MDIPMQIACPLAYLTDAGKMSAANSMKTKTIIKRS